MSTYYCIFCKQTNECIEIIAEVGCKAGPRIEANALQAFLLYHHLAFKLTPLDLTIKNMDSFDYGVNMHTSLEDIKAEFESIGSFTGYQPPVLLWNNENYKSLSARAPGLIDKLDSYQHAPGGGLWVRLAGEKIIND